jgi:hypothetical protein
MEVVADGSGMMYGDALTLLRETLEELRCRRADVGCVGPVISCSMWTLEVALEAVEATEAE